MRRLLFDAGVRATPEARIPGDWAARVARARALLPLAGLLFLVAALVLVMTPMTAPG